MCRLRSLAAAEMKLFDLVLCLEEDKDIEALQAETHAGKHCKYEPKYEPKQIQHGAQLVNTVTARMSRQGARKVRLHHQGRVQLCIRQARTKASTI